MIRRIATLLLLGLGFLVLNPSHAEAKGTTKHTIHASARPYKALGHKFKLVAEYGVAKPVKAISLGSIDAFIAAFDALDATVIDPLGVGFQAVADFLDMYVAQQLEKLPEPFEGLGDGVHVVYLGLDKFGQVLAK